MTQIPVTFGVKQSDDTLERLDFYQDGQKPAITLFFDEDQDDRDLKLVADGFYLVICTLKGKEGDSIKVTWKVGADRGTLLEYKLAADDPSVRELPDGQLLGVASFNFTVEASFAPKEA
ncbi:MAG TPA: hypothetical protein VN029_14065 [Sphingomonas sp.]|nr:hypothetical protein [Sphingomonas sp.]